MFLFILFLVVTLLAVAAFFYAVAFPDFGEMSLVGMIFALIAVGLFIGWRYETVSEGFITTPITKVERRLDGTTYVYATNTVTSAFVGKRVPDGVDLLTDDQLLDKCSMIWGTHTNRNGKIYTRQKLDY